MENLLDTRGTPNFSVYDACNELVLVKPKPAPKVKFQKRETVRVEFTTLDLRARYNISNLQLTELRKMHLSEYWDYCYKSEKKNFSTIRYYREAVEILDKVLKYDRELMKQQLTYIFNEIRWQNEVNRQTRLHDKYKAVPMIRQPKTVRKQHADKLHLSKEASELIWGVS